jgi:hypothetical protein
VVTGLGETGRAIARQLVCPPFAQYCGETPSSYRQRIDADTAAWPPSD